MPKRPQAPKHMFGHLKVQKVQKVSFADYVRNEAMLVLVFNFCSKNMLDLTFYGRVSFSLFSQKCDLR